MSGLWFALAMLGIFLALPVVISIAVLLGRVFKAWTEYVFSLFFGADWDSR